MSPADLVPGGQDGCGFGRRESCSSSGPDVAEWERCVSIFLPEMVSFFLDMRENYLIWKPSHPPPLSPYRHKSGFLVDIFPSR